MARRKAEPQWFDIVLLQSSGFELKRLPTPIEGRFDAEEKAEELNEQLTSSEREAWHKWVIQPSSPPQKKKREPPLRPFRPRRK